jgi:hypothetical protein
MQRLAQQIEVSICAAWKFCRYDLSMFPYKIQLSHLLPEDGITRPYAREFEALLEDNPGILNATWFSYEARFHLDGYITQHKVRRLDSENRRIIVAN